MPKICYQPKKFREASLQLIAQATQIITAYQQQGFDLTLRQLYYQFVARGLLANNQKNYSNLGNLISDARLAGLIDWDAIVDRTRFVRSNSHWLAPSAVLHSAADSYAIDKWRGQDNRVEVWIEKDALVGVIEAACNELDVAHFSCRGYTSQSEMWQAAQRLRQHARKCSALVILHLGDHDPSGIDMTRDIEDRLTLFLGNAAPLLEVRRIALTWAQIQQHNPPPNPAKTTDSRSRQYIDQYGTDSWELDALDPATLDQLIRAEIIALRDQDLWDEAMEEETEDRRKLGELANKWEELADDL